MPKYLLAFNYSAEGAKGLKAGGGPSGVGRAVNEAVIIAFMVLFALNSIITAIYFQVVPQNGL